MSEEQKPTEAAPAPEPTTVEAPAQKKKMALWKKILIGFVVFLVAIFVLAFVATRGAQSAADEFLADLQAGRCTEMYERATTNFTELGTLEQWEGACSQIGGILQGEPDKNGISTRAGTGENQTAEALYAIVGTDGITYDVQINIEKQDGEWMIDGFDSSAR